MDNRKNNEENPAPNEKHERLKRKVKIVGIVILCVGLIFTTIGLISFFSSFGSGTTPTLFWCAFIGLPLTGIGVSATASGFQRELMRYAKNESVPVINETGKEITPAVRDIASAVKESLSDNAEKGDTIRCSCGEENDKQSKFCKKCGKSFYTSCPSCNKEIPTDSVYCNYCGQKIK